MLNLSLSQSASAILRRPLTDFKSMPSFAISYSGDKFSQPPHDFDHAIGDIIHFFFRIETADSKSNRRMRQILSDAEAFNT